MSANKFRFQLALPTLGEISDFLYLVQIKDESDKIIFLSWISGQLRPVQKINPSISRGPPDSGKFAVWIIAWAGFKNHKAASENSMRSISLS